MGKQLVTFRFGQTIFFKEMAVTNNLAISAHSIHPRLNTNHAIKYEIQCHQIS